MLPVDDILEALELPRAEPGAGYLERLFTRFNDRVPFETASKILRDREVADPADKPRWPEVFWADHLESGTGGTCFARVAAFGALLTDLKFPTRKLLGNVLSDFDHAASQAWGVFLPERRYSARGLFVVDRQGRLAYRDVTPTPAEVPDTAGVIAALERLA